jgi:hypothetical protein
MNATTETDSASATRRGDEVLGWASALYARLASGHDGLAYHVDPRGAALTIREVDDEGRMGARRPVRAGAGDDAPKWRRARELRDVRVVGEDERAGARRIWVREGHLRSRALEGKGGGAWVCLEMGESAARRLCIDIGAELFVEIDRTFNPYVLEQHVRGRYSIAFAAPAWVEWVCIDIDAHERAGETVGEARARAEWMLGRVWRALGCSAARHPLVLRSPGGGFHVWFPLTRGATSANSEHTWPAAVARAWFERHLVAAGVELAAGDVEVFPSGRVLRAPCGAGMMLLQSARPDDPDDLGLAPWPGTMRSARVDWRGVRAELATPARNVEAMIRTFVAQWDAQRRTLADWLGRPEASWDPTWGPLGWRNRDADGAIAGVGEVAPVAEIASREKNPSEVRTDTSGRSQESDDEQGRPPRRGGEGVVGQGARSGRSLPRRRARSGSPAPSIRSTRPAAPEPDQPPESAGGPLVRGRAFREKVAELLAHGVTRPSSRWDALHTLAFYWMVTCGHPAAVVLAFMERWLRAHPHGGSRLAGEPHTLLADSLYEARSMVARLDAWLTAHPERRGNGDGGGLGTLALADHVVFAAVDPRVVGEVTVILAFLAGRAGADGGIAEPVQIATGLLDRLCGDRRVDVDGRRCRASRLAIAELVRLGVLTLAHEYVVGRRGRTWSCWYRFGSGELPRAIELDRASWDEAAPAWERAAVEAIPPAPIAVADLAASDFAPTSAPSAPAAEASQEAPAPARIVVRVVGERMLREGLLRVVSDGSRARPRAVLELAADARPTATPATRAPWFARAYRGRVITPADLAALPTEGLAKVIPFPDLEARRRTLEEHARAIDARRRMSRRDRLALGAGELAPVVALAPRPARPPAAATAPQEEGRADVRAELAAEVGAVAFDLPIDVAEVAALAWRAFGRR